MTQRKNAVFKHNRRLLFNLILVFAFAVILFIGAWTWFTSSTEADASGISVSAEAPSGVEISDSIDGEYSHSLTFTNASDGAIHSLPLISSNGSVFFKPALDNANKTVLMENNHYKGVAAIAGSDYLQHDIWFRCKNSLPVYLENDSTVTSPSDFLERLNESGLSRDYIAAATRIAFYDVGSSGTETLRYIWTPNDKWHIESSSTVDNYRRIETTSENIVTTQASTQPATGTQNSSFYFQLKTSDGQTVDQSLQMFTLDDDHTVNYYDITIPAGQTYYYNILANNTGNFILTSDNTGSASSVYSVTNSNMVNSDGTVAVTNYGFSSQPQNHQFYIKLTNQRAVAATVRIEFENNVDLRAVDISAPSVTPTVVTTEHSATLEAGSRVVFAALSGNNAQLASKSNLSIQPVAQSVSGRILTNPPQTTAFTVEKDGDYYRFKNQNNEYISLSGSSAVLTTTYTQSTCGFTLESDGTNVYIKSVGNSYLIYNGTSYIASASNSSTYNHTIYVFQSTSSSASFTTNGTAELPKFITGVYNSVQTYANHGIPFYSVIDKTNANQLLTTLSSSGWTGGETGYFYSHLRVRIWVEGTDSEATSEANFKDGHFETHLHFI